MSRRSIDLGDDLHSYLVGSSVRDTDLLRALREETAALPMAQMQIAPEQGQFMAFIVELMEARRILEVGTFTGYSTLSMAQAMPSWGRIDACDIDEETTAIARRYWVAAGVADRIALHIGPALETMHALRTESGPGTYDLIFLDADKESYDAYYEVGLDLLRRGGVIMVDNVLWGGSVINPDKRDAATEAIRAFNAKVHDDDRVSLSMVPIGDGVTLLRKR
jgi:caffeoyl-CoA O-methyltransferase